MRRRFRTLANVVRGTHAAHGSGSAVGPAHGHLGYAGGTAWTWPWRGRCATTTTSRCAAPASSPHSFRANLPKPGSSRKFFEDRHCEKCEKCGASGELVSPIFLVAKRSPLGVRPPIFQSDGPQGSWHLRDPGRGQFLPARQSLFASAPTRESLERLKGSSGCFNCRAASLEGVPG